jgi:NADPH:quinone reductase-like Zn-dependent oxidoreductase
VPLIDQQFSLEETADAFKYLRAGHAKGKIVITVD